MTDDPTKDPLALGLGSLATGVGFGGACLTAAQIIAALLRQRSESPADPLLAGLVAAVGVGGAYGWFRSFPLDNIWQRGVISVLGAVGAILVGFLAAPLDRFFGIIGMLVWLAVNLAFGIVGTRWAIKGKGTGDAGGGTGTA